MNKMKRNSGFTLVELLGVMVVLAVVITFASSTIFSVMNNSRKKMASEVRNNLAEAALSYVLESVHLDTCSVAFSKEVYENKNISNLNSNTSCTKKIKIQKLLDEGIFEDGRGFCNREDEVIVYRYNDGVTSEYKAFVSDTSCNN